MRRTALSHAALANWLPALASERVPRTPPASATPSRRDAGHRRKSGAERGARARDAESRSRMRGPAPGIPQGPPTKSKKKGKKKEKKSG